jgi:hypothetical protein
MTHCKELFIKAGLLTFPSLFVFHVLSEVHSMKCADRFTTNADVHSHATRNSSNLHQPFRKSVLTSYNIFCEGLKMYNRLENTFKQLPINLFKKRIKAMLIERALYDLNEFIG